MPTGILWISMASVLVIAFLFLQFETDIASHDVCFMISLPVKEQLNYTLLRCPEIPVEKTSTPTVLVKNTNLASRAKYTLTNDY